MNVNEDLEKMKFDCRLIDFFLNSGQITASQYQVYLDGLEDVSHMAEAVNLEPASSTD